MNHKISEDDVNNYYAGWGRHAMSDGAIWRLSLADSCMPENHIGYKVWLTKVAGTARFLPELQAFARSLAATMAKMHPKLEGREIAQPFLRGYRHEWGAQAATDALRLALFDAKPESDADRADELGCGVKAYRKIRDIVAGIILVQERQFQDALMWAHKKHVKE